MRFWQWYRTLKTGRPIPPWVTVYKKVVYGISFLALALIIVQSGLQWKLPFLLTVVSRILDYLVFISYLGDALLNFYFTYPKRDYFRKNWLDVLVFAPFVLLIVSPRSGIGLIIIRHIIVLIQTFTRTRKFANLIRGVRLNTAQIVAISFIATILLGTILLTFPVATADGAGTNFIDALFTATSATCVTGLIVQDTPSYFSTFGQFVILALIQMGGLGIMTYSAFLAIVFGRFTLGQRQMVQDMMDEDRNILSMMFYIFKMTFVIEAIGALVLFARWIFHFHDPVRTLYLSIFHSISAFCNAGFALFSDSLEQFANDPIINITIMALIIMGGLGFIAVYEMHKRSRNRRYGISTHTKLVLSASGILIMAGFLVILFVEFDASFISLPLSGKVWSALFQAVTPRTAGFNTVPMAALSPVTLTIIMILMFIGASPGSTGGGVKTTTTAILILSLRSILRGKENIEVFKRTIMQSIVYKAIALVVGSSFLLGLVFLLLLAVENKPFLPLLFEAVSAFGTVGLSTGITPDLTIGGKILIILLMYAGRIGPLTLGFALTRVLIRGKVGYPEAKVMIG
jgi:trk system potassium uptake protein TrkH